MRSCYQLFKLNSSLLMQYINVLYKKSVIFKTPNRTGLYSDGSVINNLDSLFINYLTSNTVFF